MWGLSVRKWGSMKPSQQEANKPAMRLAASLCPGSLLHNWASTGHPRCLLLQVSTLPLALPATRMPQDTIPVAAAAEPWPW